jgi:hypothetical protein
MQRHGLGVRRRHDQARCDATLRTGRAEQVGPVVASVVWRAGPRSTLGPDAGQRALLADPGLILHEGSAVNGSVAFASPILIDGTSARRWVRGDRVSQLRLRHLTCGRARSTVPHHNASCTRRSPGETRPT